MTDSDTPALGEGDEFDPWRPIEVRWAWAVPPFRASFLWSGYLLTVSAWWSRGEALWRAEEYRDGLWAKRRRDERRAEHHERLTDAALPPAEGAHRRLVRDLQHMLTDVRVLEYEARLGRVAPEDLSRLAERRAHVQQRLREVGVDG